MADEAKTNATEGARELTEKEIERLRAQQRLAAVTMCCGVGPGMGPL